MKAKIKIKPCPFCGMGTIKMCHGVSDVTFFLCQNKECSALVSFGGSKRVGNGAVEAENPLENWNRRADND